MHTKNPGYYIVIEGNDGTGKSTQVDLLAEYFRGLGQEVCIVEEPGSDDLAKSTPVANELRRIIKNGDLVRSPEINLILFSAVRRELWQQKIKPVLERGAVVLSARNYLSTLAYQGYGEGMDSNEIVRMTTIFTDERYLHPDAMLILTLDHQARADRIAMRGKLDNPDTFESRTIDFQDRVDQGYLKIAENNNITTINAADSPEKVHIKICDVLNKLLNWEK